jgi:hypothetical protein
MILENSEFTGNGQSSPKAKKILDSHREGIKRSPNAGQGSESWLI